MAPTPPSHARPPGSGTRRAARSPAGPPPAFARGPAQVHAGLWRDHRGAYGANVAAKVGRAMEVEDAAVGAPGQARALYRERTAELMAGVDLLITPPLAVVAPPSGIG